MIYKQNLIKIKMKVSEYFDMLKQEDKIDIQMLDEAERNIDPSINMVNPIYQMNEQIKIDNK